jgi:HD-GYP domain-containing protein (c-di-GMP phosphodiesterase class II)
MEQNYIPLQIATIIPERKITFDLFIFFKETYLCYLEKDHSLQSDKLEKLRNQKIARFYIKEEDERSYQKFLDAVLKEALADPKKAPDEKMNLVESAAATGIECLTNDPKSHASYQITEKAAKSLRQIIEENPTLLKKIYSNMGETISEVIKHSMNVCALSTRLGKKLGLNEKELDDLGTAALVHDIGLSKLSKDDKALFNKAKKVLTPGEKGIYKFHAKDGRKMLSDKPWSNPTVIDLVEAHEENLAGEGPMKKNKLTLAEGILSLVNNYDKRVLSQKINPKQALKELKIEEVGKYDLTHIQALGDMLKEDGLFEK